MNILFVTNHPPDQGQGISIVSFELAKAFAENTKHKIGIIYPSDQTALHINPNGLIEFKVDALGDETFKALNLLPNKINAIYDFIADFQPDVIHSHGELFLSIILQLWAIRNKVPFVQTIHFPISKLEDAEAKKISIDILYKLINKTGITEEYMNSYYHNCTAIIALNKFILKDLQQIQFKGRTSLISNAIDQRVLRGLPYPQVKSGINLIYIGTIGNRKNQKYLLQVMRYLPKSYRLTFVGPYANKWYYDSMRAYIAEHGLSNVTLTGRVSYSKIPSFLEKSHIFVSASLTEMQSLAIMESLAAARPVIGLANETTMELVKPEVGIVLPNDTTPAEFAHAIRQLVKDKKRFDTMSRNCRPVMKKFTWGIVIKKTLTLYNELIKENNKYTSSSRYKQMVDKIPSEYIQKFLKKFQPRPKKMIKYKIKPKSLIIAGGAIASSAVIFGTLKLFKKLKK